MSIYKEQIEQRSNLDDAMYKSALKEAANAVRGKEFSLDDEYPENAIGQVFKYLRVKFPVMNEEYETPEEKFEALLGMTGVVKRAVNLESGWYRDSIGVMLGRLKKSESSEERGSFVALIPDGFEGYVYFDEEHKRLVRIDSQNAGLFGPNAYCFYKPLPAKELNVWDLLKFGLESWSVSEMIYSIIMLALSTAIGLLIPKVSYMLFDSAKVAGGATAVLAIMYFGICVTVSSQLLKMMHSLITVRSGSKLAIAVKSAVMLRMFSMPQSFYKEYNSGDLSKRAAYLQLFCETLMNQVVLVAISCAFSLSYLIQMDNYAPELRLPSIIVVLVSILFTAVSSVFQIKISKEKLALTAKSNGVAFDILYGIQKIKLAGAQKRFLAKFSRAFAPAVRATYNPPAIVWMSKGISLGITLIGELVMYYQAVSKGIDSASFFSFLTAFATVSTGLTLLNEVVLQASASYSELVMAEPLLKTIPETSGQKKVLDHLNGNVEINHVSFRYNADDPLVLNDLSLKIRRGEYVALVGKSGCGKSTLVKLLLGIEKPERGTVTYNDINIDELDKTSLRRQIGTVMQDDKLFLGTVYDNLTICCPGASEDDVWEAARLAGIDEYIASLPMGMHTLITEDGGGFSGGQKQRLIIARAIAAQPSVLIFDEATSALDNKTQKVVNDSLDGLKCTRIVIAHRLSTVQNCDRICYIENGRIAEMGNYRELMEKKGKFAQLVDRQKLKEND